MTQRTQITLDQEQHSRVRKRASDLGVSMAEYLRSIIDRELGETGPRADASAIIALGDSGGSDIARQKDVYVAEAVDGLKQRR